jgi:membrane protein
VESPGKLGLPFSEVMRVRFLLTLSRRSVEEFFSDNCTQMAAAISYYVLFSLFPLLIFLVGVLGLFLQNSALQEDVIDAVLENIPLSEDQGRNDVTEAVRGVAGVGSGALGVLGLIGMAWSGSNMFGIIRRSINTAYDLEYQRPLVQQKLLDLAMVAGMGAFFLVSIGATGFLRVVRQRSEDIPHLGDAAEQAGFMWDATSFLIPLGLSFLAFAFLYWVVPATKVRVRDVWLGALVAAFRFEMTKIAFSIYLENFSNYDVVFGSLGAVAAFLFWVYLSANILLLGAEVASEYPRVLRGDYAEARPAPARPLRETVVTRLRGLFVHERKDEKDRSP